MSERLKFIVEWERRWNAAQGGRVDVAELCRMYGVSRQTGYVWIKRFQNAGHDLRSMEERSRRPLTNPRAVALEMQDLVVQARKAHPKWGPRPLRRWLANKFPRESFPSASAIALILRRRGMSHPHKRRKRPVASAVVTSPFPECTSVNQTWCMDFKGWFRMNTDEKCYPFTLLDAFSRMLLRCEALREPDGDHVRSILDSAFREYGLPQTIRSDGGPPFFSSQSPASLSAVSVWLLRLGLTIECIAPGKPQQNGRLERFHRTLKHCVAPATDFPAQQRAFDVFRAEYNHERPHAALSLETPGSVYRASPRKYPRPLLSPYHNDPSAHVETVNQRGMIAWRKRRIFIGEAFAFEHLALWPSQGHRWEIYLGAICLGFLDEQRPDLGFVPVRRPRKTTLRLNLEEDLPWHYEKQILPRASSSARAANGSADAHSALSGDSSADGPAPRNAPEPQTVCAD